MKLSIIIPCYNEEKDIVHNVEKVKQYVNSHNINHEIILVNDGSKDRTKDVIESLEGVIALSYENNRGKGGAIKYGIEKSTGDYILFMDADLSTGLDAIEKVVQLVPNYDFILGSRHCQGSVINKKQPALRVFIGWCCRLIVNMLFRFKLKDTQCGFKAIKSEYAKKIIDKQLINNFAFDVEYIYIAKLNDLSLYELGVTWSDDRESTVSPFKSSLKFFKDLAFIKKHKNDYYFDENKSKIKKNKKGAIITLVAMFFVFISLFTTFMIVNANHENHNPFVYEEKINERLLDIVNETIETDGFPNDDINQIIAVTLFDHYPNNFTLGVACLSEQSVYIYHLVDYSYSNNEKGDHAFDYLLNNQTLDLNDGSEIYKYNLSSNINNQSTNYVTYLSSFSGYIFENNTFYIYFDETYSEPLSSVTPTCVVSENDFLFTYYSYLNKQ